jgi:septal ring factor EnvC (AmiA/AmiB activator)
MRVVRRPLPALLVSAALILSSGQAASGPAPPSAAPATSAAAAAARAEREARLKALKAESDALATEKKSLLGELRRLEIDRQLKAAQLEETQTKLDDVTEALYQTTNKIAQTEHDLDAERPAIRERLVSIYKLGSLGYTRLLLSLDDARTFQRTARVVSLLAQRDRERIERYRQLIATQKTVRARLESEQQEAQSLRERIESDQRALTQAMAVRNATIKNVEEQRGLNAQLIAELTAANERLNKSLASIKSAGSTNAATGPTALVPTPNQPRFDWPVLGKLQTRFGREVSSRFGTLIARNGVEIAAPERTPVKAVRDGKVAFASAFTGFGQLVILDHGNKAF